MQEHDNPQTSGPTAFQVLALSFCLWVAWFWLAGWHSGHITVTTDDLLLAAVLSPMAALILFALFPGLRRLV